MKDSFWCKRGCLTSVSERLGRVTVVWDSNYMSTSASGFLARQYLGAMKKRLTTVRQDGRN